MSKVEVPVEFLSKVAEYVKTASDESEKLASDLKAANAKIAEAKPVTISAELSTKCAEQLVSAGFLSAQHKEAMAKSLQDPAKLADTLQKVAEAYARRPLGVVEKTAGDTSKKPSALEQASARFASAIGAGQ